MPQAVKNYGDISITSSYVARTAPSGAKTISTAPVYVASGTYSCSFADLGIPAGSTVNSASITFTAGNPLHGDGGKKLTISGTTYTTVTSGMAVAYNQGSFYLEFKSGTYNTTYPGPDPDNYTYQTNSSSYKFGSVTLTVDYTLPYATKVWNGTQWVSGTPYVYNGTQWVQGTAYVWNGTEWKPGLM